MDTESMQGQSIPKVAEPPPDQQFRDELHKRLEVAETRLEQLGLQADRTEAQRREWYRVRDATRAALGTFDVDECAKAAEPDRFVRQ